MKGFAEDNSTVSTMMINILQGVENIAEKGENAGNQHLSFTQNVFKSVLFPSCNGHEDQGLLVKG